MTSKGLIHQMKDLDEIILLNLDSKSLLTVFTINTDYYQLCYNKAFWLKRFKNDRIDAIVDQLLLQNDVNWCQVYKIVMAWPTFQLYHDYDLIITPNTTLDYYIALLQKYDINGIFYGHQTNDIKLVTSIFFEITCKPYLRMEGKTQKWGLGYNLSAKPTYAQFLQFLFQAFYDGKVIGIKKNIS